MAGNPFGVKLPQARYRADKTYWENAWHEASLRSPGGSKQRNETAWADYWDEIADDCQRDALADERFHRGIVDHLIGVGAFQRGDRVLDVGCGPGTYASLFAEAALSVDALDPSRAMLSALAREVTRRGLRGIRHVPETWEKFEPDRTYDLVFSALSPAVKDAATLGKLEACSHRSCCLVTYGQAPEQVPWPDLWETIVGERPAANVYLYVYPYNLLREQSKEPDLEIFDHARSKSVPREKLIKQYTTYFSIFTKMSARKEGQIRAYFEGLSIDGDVQVNSRSRLAVIAWNVSRDPRL